MLLDRTTWKKEVLLRKGENHEITAHTKMINTLEVAENHAVGEMQDEIDEMLAATREHRNDTQQLRQQLEDPNATDI